MHYICNIIGGRWSDEMLELEVLAQRRTIQANSTVGNRSNSTPTSSTSHNQQMRPQKYSTPSLVHTTQQPQQQYGRSNSAAIVPAETHHTAASRPSHPMVTTRPQRQPTVVHLEDEVTHYNWDEHTLEEGDIKLVKLNQQSSEYSDLNEIFKETLPNAVIDSIDRIQNKLLWKKYDDCLRRLKEQYNTNSIEERLLFHGTRTNDPLLIYGGDSSFDMRYSQQGMWGKGNYFAVNASYSDNNYAHIVGNSRQLLVAMVIIGTPFSSRENRNLIKPPPRPHKHRGVQVHYDCVMGETGGSRVYITYENDRAYPMYLITYHKN